MLRPGAYGGFTGAVYELVAGGSTAGPDACARVALLLEDVALVELGAAIAAAGGAEAGAATEAAAIVVGLVAGAVAAVVVPVDVAGTADAGTGGKVSTGGNNTGSEPIVAVADELSAIVVGGAVATLEEDAVVGTVAGVNDGSLASAATVNPAESISRPSPPSNERTCVMLLFTFIIGTSTFFAPCSRNVDRLRPGTTIRSLRIGPGAGR
jgi:hypothetical protein